MNELLDLLSRASTEPTAAVIAAIFLYALVWALKQVPYVRTFATATPVRTRATAFVLACAPALIVALSQREAPAQAALTALLTFVGATGLDKLLGAPKDADATPIAGAQ